VQVPIAKVDLPPQISAPQSDNYYIGAKAALYNIAKPGQYNMADTTFYDMANPTKW
jgi:hypothetical protein